MSTDLLLAILTILISACGVLIAYSTFSKKKTDEESKERADEARMITKLDFIGNDIKDIKAEYRSTRAELAETRRIAEHASDRAEAAHARLDRAKIDIQE